MAADVKEAKKTALMELIKHVNKKRFQDRKMDTKAALKEVGKKKDEDEGDDETLIAVEGRKKQKRSEAKEESDSSERDDEKEFGEYRKSFMKGAKLKPSSSSVSVISRTISKNAPEPIKKGRVKRG